MLNGRKTFAILIFDITAYYQNELVKYLSLFCEEKGYNLLIFSAFTIYGKVGNNANGEFNIMNLIPLEKIDAFILCHDTFESEKTTKKMLAMLKKRCTCPVVSVRKKVEGCYNILVNDERSIPSLIKHLNEEHHYDRIAFMSGPLTHPDAISRLKKYHETMEQLSLPHPDEYVFEGDFWKNMGDEAAIYFSSLEERPQAILCANDYMALSLCKGLVLQGFSIPHDFAICGFDDVMESIANIPPLTTCKVSIDKLAYLTVDTIHRLIQGKTVETDRYTDAETIIRNSCGCQTLSLHDISVCHMHQFAANEELLNQSVHNTFTSVALENLVSAEDIGDYLALEKFPNNARDFYLCLGKKGEGSFPQTRQEKPGFAKYSQSIYSLKDITPIITSSFLTSDLIPPEAIREEPMSIFFFPIHYLQYNFGYVAATSNKKEHKNVLFHSLLTIIGNTLEHTRIQSRNQSLLAKLNTLYVQDSLTNLYNRRGFEQFSNDRLTEANKKKIPSMILSIDMDNLKYINDVFGHAQGDVAIRTIALAMQNACIADEICARIGGDEYEVFGYDYNEEMAETFLHRFQQYLESFNENSKLPYQVNASTAFVITIPEKRQSLEHYMKLSDDLLYKNKRLRKEKYGNLSKRS